MKRKGSLRDIILITVLGFGMVLAGLFAIKVLNVINDQFQSSSLVPAEGKEILNTMNDRLPKWVDSAFLLFWVLLMIVGVILAMMINTNPVFIPISIFYFIFLIFISRVFSVIYLRLVESASLSTQAGLLSIIPYILPRLPLFSFIFGALIVGVMVVKR